MSSDQEVIDLGWDAYIEGLKDSYVDVGLTGHSGSEKIESGINLATLAKIHEFGAMITTSPKQRRFMQANQLGFGPRPQNIPSADNDGQNFLYIPKRPFMRVSFDDHLPELRMLVAQLELAILLKLIKREDALERLGDSHKAVIQRNMRTKHKFAPNAPSTIRMKGSDNELIDTGRLVNAIDIKVTA